MGSRLWLVGFKQILILILDHVIKRSVNKIQLPVKLKTYFDVAVLVEIWIVTRLVT